MKSDELITVHVSALTIYGHTYGGQMDPAEDCVTMCPAALVDQQVSSVLALEHPAFVE